MAAMKNARTAKRGRELLSEGSPIKAPLLIIEGWAARIRTFEDGRMQIVSFLLAGDLIGHCDHPRPLSVSTVMALTDLRYCEAPSPSVSPSLQAAYAVSRALEEAYLLSHIARLGRLTAEERLADLLLELLERLELCGLVEDGSYAMPLAQHTLADATGLTVVHVNRMVRQLRHQQDIVWQDGYLTINDPQSLARKLGRRPTRVTDTLEEPVSRLFA
jgi:CRP-like cAMP-binding protein